MDINIKEFKIKEEELSAGLCDKCNKVQPYNTGGDGINEPEYIEPMCMAKMIVVGPLPKDEQVKECEFFEPSEIIKGVCQFCGKENYLKYDKDEKLYLCLTCKNNRKE